MCVRFVGRTLLVMLAVRNYYQLHMPSCVEVRELTRLTARAQGRGEPDSIANNTSDVYLLPGKRRSHAKITPCAPYYTLVSWESQRHICMRSTDSSLERFSHTKTSLSCQNPCAYMCTVLLGIWQCV